MKLLRSAGRAGRELRRRLRDETGAALMIVLVTLVGLTALAAAGLIISESDIRVTQNMDAGTRAFYAAEAALNDYLGINDTIVTPTSSYSYAEGTAAVTAEPLLGVNALLTLYRVTSVGSFSPAEGGTATRTLSRLVLYHAGGNNKVSAPGAITAVEGLQLTGGADSAMVSGLDVADPSTCSSAGTDIPGVTVPDSAFTTNTDTSTVSGDPPIDDSYPTDRELAESLNIDWAEVLDGGVVPFDYVVNDIKNDFPDLSKLGPNDWPVTFVDLTGDKTKNVLAAKESGQGLLIISGDIDLSGEFQWDGVILVGGRLEASGGTRVTGAVISGLNVLTGGTPAATDLGHGGLQFLYNSCYAHEAFRNLGVYPPRFAEKPGTWHEAM